MTSLDICNQATLVPSFHEFQPAGLATVWHTLKINLNGIVKNEALIDVMFYNFHSFIFLFK